MTTKPTTRRVIVLGSTGSVGTQALEVIDELNSLDRPETPRFEIVGLAAGGNADLLRAQSHQWPDAATSLAAGNDDCGASFVGADAATKLVQETDADLVIAAIVGLDGLDPVLAAIERGIDIALANKESLVAAGEIVMALARTQGVRILPLDSEHSGVWQCLLGVCDGTYAPPDPAGDAVTKIVLTASGGPFRTWPAERINTATRDQALAHPVWSMGQKNTIDSATLMNKGLELLEARWLFDCTSLGVLVHPSSTVHAIIELADGQSVCQMAVPDMRLPIHLALAFPQRLPSPRPRLDLASLGTLVFEEPDRDRFPSLALAERAMNQGGTSGAVLSAANEVAVAAFLDGSIEFGSIPQLVERALDEIDIGDGRSLDAVREADRRARTLVEHSLRETS